MNLRILNLKWRRPPQLLYINYRLKSEVSITLHCQLCSTCFTAFGSRTVRNVPLQSTHAERRNGVAHPSYHLKSEVSIMLRCWLCSTRYTAVRIKNCLKSTSTIKIATMKNTNNFRYEGKPSCDTPKSTLLLSAKMNGTQKRTLVSP